MNKLKRYHKYLKSEKWRCLRLLAILKADGKCECCGSEDNLHGHHTYYSKYIEDCIVEQIMCLCEDCHNSLHNWMRKTKSKLIRSRFNTIRRIKQIRNI